MAEQPEEFIEEEEDDDMEADSRSERSAEWRDAALQPLPGSAPASDDRLFTAGARRTYEIPTVNTRFLSGLPPAASSPVLVSAQRTVYSVDHGLVQVQLREQVGTPPSPVQRDVTLASRELPTPSPQPALPRGDISMTSRDSMNLSPQPAEETTSDRLSSATPTPTASPLPRRPAETPADRPSVTSQPSVTSEGFTPGGDVSEGESAPLLPRPVSGAAGGDSGDGEVMSGECSGDDDAAAVGGDVADYDDDVVQEDDDAAVPRSDATVLDRVGKVGESIVSEKEPVISRSEGLEHTPEGDIADPNVNTMKLKPDDGDVGNDVGKELKSQWETEESTAMSIEPVEEQSASVKDSDKSKEGIPASGDYVPGPRTDVTTPRTDVVTPAGDTTSATTDVKPAVGVSGAPSYSRQSSDQSKRSVLTLAGSSQNIRGMIDKFNHISDSPETSTPLLQRRELQRPRVDPPNLTLQLQKSLSDGLVMLASRDDGDDDDDDDDINLIAQTRSASGAAVLQPEPSSGTSRGLSPSVTARGGADAHALAARPPRWSPLPPIASQVPHLTNSPASVRTRVGSGAQATTPSTPASASSSSGVTSPFTPGVTSSVTSLGLTTPTGFDSSLDSSIDSAFEAARVSGEGRSPTPTARAERLRRARDQFFGATWSTRPSPARGEEETDTTTRSGRPFPFGAESPQRPPRRRFGSRAAGLAHSKSTGTINESSLRHSNISCGSDFSDVSAEEPRGDPAAAARAEATPPPAPAAAAAAAAQGKTSAGSRMAHFLRLRHAKKRKGSAIGALIRQSMALNAGQSAAAAAAGGSSDTPSAAGAAAGAGAALGAGAGPAADSVPPPAPVRSCPSTPMTERAARPERRQKPGWRAKNLFRSPTPPENR